MVVTCDILVDLMIFLARAKTKRFTTLSDLTRLAPFFLILKLHNFFCRRVLTPSKYTPMLKIKTLLNAIAVSPPEILFYVWCMLELLTELNAY